MSSPNLSLKDTYQDPYEGHDWVWEPFKDMPPEKDVPGTRLWKEQQQCGLVLEAMEYLRHKDPENIEYLDTHDEGVGTDSMVVIRDYVGFGEHKALDEKWEFKHGDATDPKTYEYNFTARGATFIIGTDRVILPADNKLPVFRTPRPSTLARLGKRARRRWIKRLAEWLLSLAKPVEQPPSCSSLRIAGSTMYDHTRTRTDLAISRKLSRSRVVILPTLEKDKRKKKLGEPLPPVWNPLVSIFHAQRTREGRTRDLVYDQSHALRETRTVDRTFSFSMSKGVSERSVRTQNKVVSDSELQNSLNSTSYRPLVFRSWFPYFSLRESHGGSGIG